LLESIRSGVLLKSAKDRTVVPEVAVEDTGSTSVASILARRIAIVGSSSESESDNDGNWDD
jgi:hypothetical protein